MTRIMNDLQLNTVVLDSKARSQMRFPHPFVYHFEKNSSLGISAGTKYFRGCRVQNKPDSLCDPIK